VRAISGRSASYGPPESVEKRNASSRTMNRYAAVAAVPEVGGVKTRNEKSTQNGVAARTNGMRRPSRVSTRSLQ
jgi:hypothetical protein